MLFRSQDLPYIFDRFYRMDKARSWQENGDGKLISGSGLGLAISKSIVEIYGGRIEVQNRADNGAVFTVWLPGV